MKVVMAKETQISMDQLDGSHVFFLGNDSDGDLYLLTGYHKRQSDSKKTYQWSELGDFRGIYSDDYPSVREALQAFLEDDEDNELHVFSDLEEFHSYLGTLI